MQTFDQALFDLAEAGQITTEEALRHADAVNDLRLRFKLEGKGSGDAAKKFEGADKLDLVRDLTRRLGLKKD